LGEEYTSNKFYELLALDGTIHQTLCTNTPKQNGVAERKFSNIVETTHSLLLFASVHSAFWGETTFTVVGVINAILSSHILGLSSFEKLYEYTPDYSFFRVFGCTCFIICPHVEHRKLSS